VGFCGEEALIAHLVAHGVPTPFPISDTKEVIEIINIKISLSAENSLNSANNIGDI